MNLVSENLASEVMLSARVAPDIPAYAFCLLSVALNPLSASMYLQSIISGL